ncbi:MAG TPA: hypothetical protein VGB14_13335 [Acidimicrobiales bacterium]
MTTTNLPGAPTDYDGLGPSPLPEHIDAARRVRPSVLALAVHAAEVYAALARVERPAAARYNAWVRERGSEPGTLLDYFAAIGHMPSSDLLDAVGAFLRSEPDEEAILNSLDLRVRPGDEDAGAIVTTVRAVRALLAEHGGRP